MWARVKGQTERAIPVAFKAAYAFRPAYIQPLNGIAENSLAQGVLCGRSSPLPVWKALFPSVTTTACIGRAMIHVARAGAPKRVLVIQDINEICGAEK
jgi:hypothetical protein